MNHITYVLGALAALCTAVAGFYAHSASTVKAEPVWDRDPELKPRNMQEHTFGMMNAIFAAQFWGGYHAKRAAIWGMIAAVLGVLAAVTAWPI